MLLHLPTEIILTVSRYLDFRDKLSLNATCKKINNLISKTTLYEELDLLDYGIGAITIIQDFEENHFKVGNQVKILKVDMQLLSERIISQLSSIFPKVTELVAFDHHDISVYSRSVVSEPVATWINTMEVLKTGCDWYPIWVALQLYTFPHLTELEITADNPMLIIRRGFKAHSLLALIKNAPLLNKLVIRNLDLTLDILDEIHASCQHIKSLTLENIVIIINKYVLPKPFIPAHSVLCLEIDSSICIDKDGLLLNYILKKYPSLQKICFDPQYISSYIAIRLNLYYPGFSAFFFNHNLDRNLVNTRIPRNEYGVLFSELRSTFEVYRRSRSTFFSRLPTTIKSIKIDTKYAHGTIESLIKSKSNLVELEIRNLQASFSGNTDEPIPLVFIENLKSLKTLRLPLNPLVQILVGGIVSTSITKLQVDIRGDSLYIDRLLSAFPSLKELCLTGNKATTIQVGHGNKSYSKNIYFNLQKIRTEFVLAQHNLFDYIKVAAPNVKVLDLNIGMISNLPPEETVHDLDLSGLNLEKCHLEIFNVDGYDHHKECEITIKNTTSRFIFPGVGDRIMIPGRNSVFKYWRYVIRLNIKCDDIKQFKLSGRQLKKMNNEVKVVTERYSNNTFIKW